MKTDTPWAAAEICVTGAAQAQSTTEHLTDFHGRAWPSWNQPLSSTGFPQHLPATGDRLIEIELRKMGQPLQNNFMGLEGAPRTIAGLRQVATDGGFPGARIFKRAATPFRPGLSVFFSILSFARDFAGNILHSGHFPISATLKGNSSLVIISILTQEKLIWAIPVL